MRCNCAFVGLIGTLLTLLSSSVQASGSIRAATERIETVKLQRNLQTTLNLVELVEATADLSALYTAILAAGLEVVLSGEGPLTFFTPTNLAFTAIPDKLLSPGYVLQLRELIAYHVTNGTITSDKLTDGQEINMLNSEMVAINTTNGVAITDTGGGVSNVIIPSANVLATNGVAHMIDGVLCPTFFHITINDIMQGEPRLTTLAGVISQPFRDALRIVRTSATLLAPTNDAFAAMNPTLLDFIVNDPTALQDLLLNHVLEGASPAELLFDGEIITPVGDTPIVVSVSNDAVMVNDATVIEADDLAINGIVHLLDTVLLPALLEVEGEFPMLSSLKTALDLFGLSEILISGEYTIFAPTNTAFVNAIVSLNTLNPLLATALADGSPNSNWALHIVNLLQYHVAAGLTFSGALPDEIPMLNGDGVTIDTSSGIMINQATVEATDVPRKNALIHVIDSVLLPSWVSKTIVDIATETGSFTTLLSLLTQVNLAETLTSFGQAGFTVFAPTDDAFAGVDTSGLSDAAITRILLYHVVSGVYPLTVLSSGPVVTVGGLSVDIIVDGTSVAVNNVSVVSANALAANGIIHGIAEVLLPPESEMPTSSPSVSAVPTEMLSSTPSVLPSLAPSAGPSAAPVPTTSPSGAPSVSSSPTEYPVASPTAAPSSDPTMSTSSGFLPSILTCLSITLVTFLI
jgi:transforming growth factor-beta-induced protein